MKPRIIYPKTSDEDIIKMKNGDPEAASRVFNNIARIAAQQSIRFGQSYCDIDDIVGKTVLSVYEGGIVKGGYKFKPPGFDALTTMAAQNVIRDRMKSTAAKINARSMNEDINDLTINVSGKNEITALEDVLLLEKILSEAKISEENLYCFLCKDYYRLPMEEIVVKVKDKFQLDMTIGALKQRLLRTRQELQRVARAMQQADEKFASS